MLAIMNSLGVRSLIRRNTVGVAIAMVLIAAWPPAKAARLEQEAAIQVPAKAEKEMRMEHAEGTFDVVVTPQKADNQPAEESKVGRMSIDKKFHGDLEATSKGEMLAAMSEVKGSAGYVAMERVTGKLKGKSGSFVLQHNATMNRGVPELDVIVVPDSGTGELVGISGKMNIIIGEGKHSYTLDYAIAKQP